MRRKTGCASAVSTSPMTSDAISGGWVFATSRRTTSRCCLTGGHRRQLEKRGVLIVGPNATFLRYIGQVLPALGETGVVLSTLSELYPGVTPQREEAPDVAVVKGRLAMAGVVAGAVRDRQQVPRK